MFASRSTFRPNGLGLSLVRLEGIDTTADDAPVLLLGGLDLLDGTPVYDIKPYLPYAESVPGAAAGFASDEIPRLTVEVADDAAEEFSTPAGTRPGASSARPSRSIRARRFGRRIPIGSSARCFADTMLDSP